MEKEKFEQAKSRLHIVDIVSRYLPLQRSGSHWTGRCPFHDDRNPSLVVYPATNSFHCFGCGADGDVISFIMKMENCSFAEACRKEGIELAEQSAPAPRRPDRRASRSDSGTPSTRAAPPPLPTLAPEPWEPTPSLAPFYKLFGVHLAPPEGIDGRRTLAGRVVFPLHDEHGQLVGHAGRRLSDDGSAKYVNPTNGGGYQKSRFLYGMDKAGPWARHRHHLYLVEGYKDVIAMHAAGLCETVALCGTALSEGHLELIGRYTHRVVLLLDGDEAGQRASAKAAHQLASHGFHVEQLRLPHPDDPDAIARRAGPDALAQLVEQLRIAARPDPEQQLMQRIRLWKVQVKAEPQEQRRTRLLHLYQWAVQQFVRCSQRIQRPASMDTQWIQLP